MASILSVFVLAHAANAQTATDLHYIGQFATEHPSFIELLNVSSSPHLDLIVTNFAETGSNGISAFYNIGLYLRNISNGHAPPKTILADKTLTWPNLVYIAEPNIFPADLTLMAHDGFLTPLHSKGGIYALLLNNSAPIDLVRLSPDAEFEDCYYHNSTMIDLNGDGLTDILASQVCKNIFGQQSGSLVWFEQPKSDVTKTGSWNKNSLVPGPDFLITTEMLNETTVIVYSAQFFDAKLVYYYLRIGVDKPYIVGGDGTVIDDTIGSVEGIQIVDVLKNGKKQILVNNHLANGSLTGVFLYEFPDNFPYGTSDKFIKHQIASGFNTTGGVGVGAPGFCTLFDLNAEQDKSEPYKIGVAGDGNFISWQLTATDPQTFSYSKSIIKSVGGTSGILAFGDVDGDGYTEAFVPYYEDGIIYVYTANPDARKYHST